MLEFDNCIMNLYSDETVQKMDKMKHHLGNTCMDHSLFVAYMSYSICKKFGWDYESAARAGLLHDLFLYDWKKGTEHEGLHGVVHPRIAYENAEELCRENENEEELNSLEKDIILKHMWPLASSMPKYKESFVVCIADKVCAMAELSLIYRVLRFRKVKSLILRERKIMDKQKITKRRVSKRVSRRRNSRRKVA